MSFERFTWKDRITQYPTKRKIEYIDNDTDSNVSIVNITRDEGEITNEGTAFNALTMNNLEDRIYNMSNSIDTSLSNLSSKFPVTVANGGTGATTESGIRQNLGIRKEYSLYSNSSGTYSTITLSDNYTNYDVIKILFQDNGVYNTAEFYTDVASQTGLANIYTSSGTTLVYLHSCLLSFSGSQATFSRNGYTSMTSSSISNNTTASAGVTVKKILGYKY